jgi:steroid delta-isomerase-like uncharacterized protein
MTTQSKQDLLQARIKLVADHIKAENDHDLDAIMATFGKNAKFNLNAVPLSGPDGIRGLYAGFGFGEGGSFSNIQVDVKQQHVSDESIVVELVLKGKHIGSFQGIAATNREFEVPACAIFDFDEDEKLASERVYFDGAFLLQQLGVLGAQ